MCLPWHENAGSMCDCHDLRSHPCDTCTAACRTHALNRRCALPPHRRPCCVPVATCPALACRAAGTHTQAHAMRAYMQGRPRSSTSWSASCWTTTASRASWESSCPRCRHDELEHVRSGAGACMRPAKARWWLQAAQVWAVSSVGVAASLGERGV
jgi:hypothetical protein